MFELKYLSVMLTNVKRDYFVWIDLELIDIMNMNIVDYTRYGDIDVSWILILIKHPYIYRSCCYRHNTEKIVLMLNSNGNVFYFN